MGRPFAAELEHLDKTVTEVAAQDISEVVEWVASASNSSVLAVGSGGSLSAADWLAALHETYSGHISRSATPLQVVELPRVSRQTAVGIISAGGSNADILAAAGHVAAQEPRDLLGLCAQARSPLVERLSSLGWPRVATTSLSAGRDGFLATNSLMAFAHILARAYAHVFASDDDVPRTIDELRRSYRTHVGRTSLTQAAEFWRRDYLIVLHGSSTRSAALDLESKFSEAALGSVHVADYRNFAHGRHHWLAKRAHSTAIIAFTEPDVRALASRTLRLVPKSVPVAEVELGHAGIRAGLAAFLAVFDIVHAAGLRRGIDPGRPGVPEFGRKLYSLGLPKRNRVATDAIQAAAVRRKQAAVRLDEGRLSAAYSRFLQQMRDAKFGGVVCDYDGTLCDRAQRYAPGLHATVERELRRLTAAGLALGIATGRGRSVAAPLRRAVGENHWDRVWVGYYNGSIIRPLAADLEESLAHNAVDEIRVAAELLRRDERLVTWAEIEPRYKQITVTSRDPSKAEMVWALMQDALVTLMPAVAVVRSSHSFDVLSSGVSKLDLVAEIQRRVHPLAPSVLCIGDAGRWPGNDARLLAEPLSLSVDEVSTSLETCWNLAPDSERGACAAVRYLRALHVRGGVGRFTQRSLGTK